jgi:hypothetical protein
MNWEIYFIIVSTSTMLSLIWRNFLDDNKSFLNKLSKTPIIGKALTCSFCYPQWFSLFTVILFIQISEYEITSITYDYLNIIISWIVVSFGVTFFRPLISLILDKSALAHHDHLKMHEH